MEDGGRKAERRTSVFSLPPSAHHPSFSVRRLWLFRAICLIFIPALFFLFLELGLRILHFGFSPAAIVKCKVNGTSCYRNNIQFAWRFFPPTIARETSPFVFPAVKSSNTYRIFVLGESAAAGTPNGAFCFGRILQVMLRQQYPQVDFQVITAAMPAINSHVILEIAKDCARRQPDLFIAYMGNNEVVGPYGAGTVFAPLSANLSLIRFDMAFKATRVGQLLTRLTQKVHPQKDVFKVWRGLEMFLDKQIPADAPSLAAVYQHFQKNLEDISRVARNGKTNIIFSTVGTNLKDCPPFASLHRPDLTETEKTNWDDLYQQGMGFESAGDYAQAVERYLAAAEINAQYADLQFRLGHCLWATGEYGEARERFIQARDLDTLRFRADTRINQIIRDVAGDRTSEGIYLVDAVKVFQDYSPNETPGEELFYEHVHMNFAGAYLLAGAIVRQVEEVLPERIKRCKMEDRPLPTQAECARYLAYTYREQYEIADQVLNLFIKRPPFTGQLYQAQRLSKMEQSLKALKTHLSPQALNEAQAEYRWAIEQRPTDWWLHWQYGELLEELANFSAAAEQYRLVLDLVPHSYEAYAKLGSLAGKQGSLDAAIRYNQEAVRISPAYAGAYFNLALAYQLQGRPNESVQHYSKAIQFRPDYAQAYNNKAAVLYQQGEIRQAEQTYRDGLAAAADYLDLHYNLAILLAQQDRSQEAVKELRTALAIDPNSTKTSTFLKTLLETPSK